MTHKPKTTTRRSGPTPVAQSARPVSMAAPHHPWNPVHQASHQHGNQPQHPANGSDHMPAEPRAFIPADSTILQPLAIRFQGWYMVRPVAGTWIRYTWDQIAAEILNSRWSACWVMIDAPHYHFEKTEVPQQAISTQAQLVPVQERYWVRQLDGTWIQYTQDQIDAEESDGRWIGYWMRFDGPQCYFVERVLRESENGGE